MGYYSEVAYVIAFDDQDAMGKFITHVFGSEDAEMIDALKSCEVDFENLRINFHSASSKWYESYTDVKGHTRMYELVDDEDTLFFGRCSSRLVRVGEETGDIEEDDHGDEPPWDDFYPVTTIQLPFSAKYETYGEQLAKLTPPQPTEGETA